MMLLIVSSEVNVRQLFEYVEELKVNKVFEVVEEGQIEYLE